MTACEVLPPRRASGFLLGMGTINHISSINYLVKLVEHGPRPQTYKNTEQRECFQISVFCSQELPKSFSWECSGFEQPRPIESIFSCTSAFHKLGYNVFSSSLGTFIGRYFQGCGSTFHKLEYNVYVISKCFMISLFDFFHTWI